MSQQLSPRLSLPFLLPSQAQKHVIHNEALQTLDLLVQLTVAAFDAEIPPATPSEGRIWALGPMPIAAWAGHPGELAAWVGGGWMFLAPSAGWRAAMGAELRVWDGLAWVPPVLDNLPGLGINTGHDATHRLAVAADATLLGHDGGGHRLKLDKATAADTASLLFQTGGSGRAEMGTAGGDTFALGVSADGASWHTGLEIQPSDGCVTLPAGLVVRGAFTLDGVPGTLGSLGQIAGAADQMPYWTGAGAMAATTLTPSARQLLASDRIGVSGDTLTTPGTARLTGGAVTQSATDTTAGRLLKVGDFGIGDSPVPWPGADLGAVSGVPGGFYRTGAETGGANPTGEPRSVNLLIRRGAGEDGALLHIPIRADGRAEIWLKAGRPMGAWARVLSTADTTVDSNGFVKAASPIVRLYSDRIEEPVQPTGAVMRREDVGVYRLAGTPGLAQEGWRIEVPRDHNGNRLCHVGTDWRNGILTVTVATPLWDAGRWVAGDPIDVPKGRWIDIRLHEDGVLADPG